MNIEISKIKIGNRRALGDLTELASSIKEIGLLNPITVTQDFNLIAGHHRLKAFELLGIELIPVRIVDCTALQAELAEIDENLIRNNGTELEQGISLARRKVIYLELHPETKNGAQGGGGTIRVKKAKNDTVSFCSDTANKTNQSKRTTERKVSIGEKLGGMQDEIKAAGIDDSQKDLTELAKLKDKAPEQVQAVLNIVASESLSVKSAIRQISLNNQKEAIESGNIEKPTGLFDVISIDPPWKYEQGESNSYNEDGRRVANPYPEMTLEQIKALSLPVKDDSVMWLWTTQKFLNDSFSLLEEWGFEHKATMVWDKEQMGMGHWLRMQCEFCLLAVKGNPVWSNTHVRDILREKRREHSRKPEEFYKIVNEICVGDKLDYFSRESREGWVNFGNDKELFNA
jgi:N6-adenosine-specific RNA methylase IME4